MADIKVISATLLSGHNTVQVTDPIIGDGSIFEIYVSDPNIICNNIVVGGTTANITFDSKPTENTSIKVLVNNISNTLKVASADVTDGETTQSAINTSVSNSISTLTSGKADLSTLNDRVPSETVLGGVLYHGTTGNVWKKLTGANVDYDENNTVNQKIDACFQSVSSGKILIADAITDKGVETSATDTFQTMADNISQIETGGGLELFPYNYHYTNDNIVTIRSIYLSGTYNSVSYGGTGGETYVIDLGENYANITSLNCIISTDESNLNKFRPAYASNTTTTSFQAALEYSFAWDTVLSSLHLFTTRLKKPTQRYLCLYISWYNPYKTKSNFDTHVKIHIIGN